MKLSVMQKRLAKLILKHGLNGSLSTTELACRAKTSRLAVWSAMRSLAAKNLAGCFRTGDDRWAASMWFLRDGLRLPDAELKHSDLKR